MLSDYRIHPEPVLLQLDFTLHALGGEVVFELQASRHPGHVTLTDITQLIGQSCQERRLKVREGEIEGEREGDGETEREKGERVRGRREGVRQVGVLKEEEW